MEWNNNKILKFIRMYETEPILWNPEIEGHKRKDLVYEAWARIRDKLNWDCTIGDLKKKRASLMAYYRQHLNKHKKSLQSEAETEDNISISWFAFGALHNFLQPIYDHKLSASLIPQMNDDEETNTSEEDVSRTGGEHTNQAKRACMRDISPERFNYGHQSFEDPSRDHNNHHNDEYEIFGKLIATKLRKINNNDIKEILMNDIHNVVFKAGVMDRRNSLTITLPPSFVQINIDPPNIVHIKTEDCNDS